MLLTQLIHKNVYYLNQAKCVCIGIGVSTKNFAIKYLLCRSITNKSNFCINFSAIEYIGEDIFLSHLRPVIAKSCIFITLKMAVYTFSGKFLGELLDASIQDFTIKDLILNDRFIIPIENVSAINDVVILKKKQNFPLGERIPAPFSSQRSEKLITKAVLKSAMQESRLIRLTLSLPLFKGK